MAAHKGKKRPEVHLDAAELEKMEAMASVGCTQEEVASVLEISADTIQRKFIDCFNKGKNKMCASLRSRQYRLAMEGNPTMLIWLGKQVLGQRDIVETKGDMVHHFVSGVPEDLSEEEWEAQYGAPEAETDGGSDSKIH